MKDIGGPKFKFRGAKTGYRYKLVIYRKDMITRVGEYGADSVTPLPLSSDKQIITPSPRKPLLPTPLAILPHSL